ncbi:MAG: serpin family protein [Ruminococcaceae bacterium]|nr:serpin family protein [Oscillospiraceae bacterium]
MRNIIKHILPSILAMLLLSSCADTTLPRSTPEENAVTHTTPEASWNYRDLAAAAKNPTGKASDEHFAESLTDFSEALFKKCAVRGENLILSPLSLTYALTLTSNGAHGDTLCEFESLNGGISTAEMNEYLFWNALTLASTKESKVKVANSLWTDDGFPVNSQFKWIAEKYYNADAVSADFTSDAMVDELNAWVSERTDGMIDTVMDTPPADLVMLIVNTVLFDGKWETPYGENMVSEGIFTNYDGTEAQAELMYSHEAAYFTGDGYSGFSKPYTDGYRFIALLPEEGTDIYNFADNIDWSDAIEKALDGNLESADCYLPKFEADWEMGLNEILMDMGLKKAFTADAELDGLSETGSGLFISSVRQKAVITVNESGTKAAAYSEVAVDECEHPMIRLNRPFAYAIVDSETGIPLFLGILADMK